LLENYHKKQELKALIHAPEFSAAHRAAHTKMRKELSIGASYQEWLTGSPKRRQEAWLSME